LTQPVIASDPRIKSGGKQSIPTAAPYELWIASSLRSSQ
jgi:hypothetical protein